MVVMNKRKLRTPVRKYICKLFDFGCSARLDEDAAGQNIGVCLFHQLRNGLIKLLFRFRVQFVIWHQRCYKETKFHCLLTFIRLQL